MTVRERDNRETVDSRCVCCSKLGQKIITILLKTNATRQRGFDLIFVALRGQASCSSTCHQFSFMMPKLTKRTTKYIAPFNFFGNDLNEWQRKF